MRELSARIEERTLVTAHLHIQFDRRVAGIRSNNAGSVGIPYEKRPGAHWAILGPDVELRRTEYSIKAAAGRYRTSELGLKGDGGPTCLTQPLHRAVASL